MADQPTPGLNALREASTALHRIAMAMGARKLIAKGISSPRLRESIERQVLDDHDVGNLAADAFEACVLAMKDQGADDVTIFECTTENWR